MYAEDMNIGITFRAANGEMGVALTKDEADNYQKLVKATDNVTGIVIRVAPNTWHVSVDGTAKICRGIDEMTKYVGTL